MKKIYFPSWIYDKILRGQDAWGQLVPKRGRCRESQDGLLNQPGTLFSKQLLLEYSCVRKQLSVRLPFY